MTALLQTVVAEFLDGLVRAYGPFVLPVTLFVAGAVGYVVLVAIGRAGIGDDLTRGDAAEPDAESAETVDEDADARDEDRT